MYYEMCACTKKKEVVNCFFGHMSNKPVNAPLAIPLATNR